MEALAELDRYLAAAYDRDYWYDVAIDRAAEMTAELVDAEWTQLEQMWPERPVEWQVRLAEAVSESGRLSGPDLLGAMVRSDAVPVACTAATRLATMTDVWAPDPSLRPHLERLLPQVEPGYRTIIAELIAATPDGSS